MRAMRSVAPTSRASGFGRRVCRYICKWTVNGAIHRMLDGVSRVHTVDKRMRSLLRVSERILLRDEFQLLWKTCNLLYRLTRRTDSPGHLVPASDIVQTQRLPGRDLNVDSEPAIRSIGLANHDQSPDAMVRVCSQHRATAMPQGEPPGKLPPGSERLSKKKPQATLRLKTHTPRSGR